MTTYDYDIGIIGGGAGGLTVAAGAAQLGAKTLLIEKEKELGGDCLHFGCVPSKTLIKSAHVYHLMKNAEKFGLPKMDVPPVEFKNVSDRVRSVIQSIQHHDSVERFCGLGAQVEFGNPSFTDEHTIRLNDKTYTAKAWVIASGSSAIIPPIEGLDQTPYITNKEIFYLDKLPQSMIVLGAGPIGVEMAQAFSRFGTDVTVVDMAPQILPYDDQELADTVMETLISEGVKFYVNHTIEAVSDLGNERNVTVKHKDGSVVSLKAETLLVALGRIANVEGLGLETIGVEHDRRGIPVDSRMRTNHKHIYAVGDVNGGFQCTHAACYEGGSVVSNAIFRLPRKADYTYLPWCTFTDPPLGNIGMNEKMAQEAGINVRMILTHEDIAPGADAPIEDRRGLAGCIPLYKVAGAAAEAGIGLALLPMKLGASSKRLKCVFPKQPDITNNLWVITHPDLVRSARVHAFIEHFAEEIAGSL